MRKTRGFIAGLLALVLAISLVAGSCAPAAPTGEEGAEEIAKLEKEVAAEKAKAAAVEKKVGDLEKEIAALKKPAEVIDILLESGVWGGMPQIAAEYFTEQIEKASGGRIQAEIVIGDAITPTEEQLEATGEGVFDMLLTWHPYFRKKIPLLDITVYDSVTLRTREDAWTMYEFKGWGDLMRQEFAKLNVRWLVSVAQSPGSFLFSRVPIPDFASLEGMKIRGTGMNGMILSEAGAAVVVLSGGELYPSLASGLVEAGHYSTPGAMYDMGIHEVTSYWIMPPISKMNEHGFDANMDFWNNLSEADQALVYNISKLALLEGSYNDWYNSIEALAKVQEVGVEIQYWDEASIKQWTAAGMKILPEPRDEASTLAREQLFDYMRSMGYID